MNRCTTAVIEEETHKVVTMWRFRMIKLQLLLLLLTYGRSAVLSNTNNTNISTGDDVQLELFDEELELNTTGIQKDAEVLYDGAYIETRNNQLIRVVPNGVYYVRNNCLLQGRVKIVNTMTVTKANIGVYSNSGLNIFNLELLPTREENAGGGYNRVYSESRASYFIPGITYNLSKVVVSITTSRGSVVSWTVNGPFTLHVVLF